MDYTIARGDKGKTFFLRCLYERARLNGRVPLLRDCDPGNRTLADSMFHLGEEHAVGQPVDRTSEERIRFLKGAVAESTTNRVLVDPGASDRSAMELNGGGLSQDAEDAFAADWGGSIVDDLDIFASVPNMNVWYFTGGDPSDMTLMDEVLTSPLAKKNIYIVLNEGVQRYDWSEVQELPSYKRALDAGAREFYFPMCGAGVAMRAVWGGKTFREAILGEPLVHPRTGEEMPLAVHERQALKSFLAVLSLRIRHSGMEDLLP